MAESSLGAISEALREPGTLQRVLCAAVAWTVTVAPIAFSSVGGVQARLCAATAIVCGLVGPAMAVKRRRVGRHVGISGYLLFSTLVWVLTPSAIDPDRIDSIRAAIGAVAWGVYALSWGEPWTAFGAVERKVEADPFAAPLRARATLAPFAVPIATLGVGTAMVLLVGIWQIHDRSRALIAQAVGVAVSVAIVGAAATVAVSRGKPRGSGERAVGAAVVRALLVLVFVAVAGAIVLVLRG